MERQSQKKWHKMFAGSANGNRKYAFMYFCVSNIRRKKNIFQNIFENQLNRRRYKWMVNSQNMYKYNGIVEQLMCGCRDFVIALHSITYIFFFNPMLEWQTYLSESNERCCAFIVNIWWNNEQWTLRLISTVNNNINSLWNREYKLYHSMRCNRISVECWFVRLMKVPNVYATYKIHHHIPLLIRRAHLTFLFCLYMLPNHRSRVLCFHRISYACQLLHRFNW